MEANRIQNADILDIIFEGRNKDYGAYDLHKTYNKRVVLALLFTVAFCLLLIVGYSLRNRWGGDTKNVNLVKEDVELTTLKEDKKIEPVIPPPKIIPKKVEMRIYTSPKIVQEVKEEERPPEIKDLEQAKIGLVNQSGTKDDDIVAPPVSDEGKGVVEAPKDNENYDKTFIRVEVESEYPGGEPAWSRYLHKNLNYPEEAQNNEIQGDVIVQFIVDKEGNVSDVEAVKGPDELRAEAVRVIKKSGKWKPAIQNGRLVKSYKKQLIIFRITAQ